MLVHNVFLTLKDSSPEATARVVQSAKELLSHHDGIEFFGIGPLADYHRDVNDRDFHLALVVVFRDPAAHDAYQVHPDHIKFRDTNIDNFARLRVFDSLTTD